MFSPHPSPFHATPRARGCSHAANRVYVLLHRKPTTKPTSLSTQICRCQGRPTPLTVWLRAKSPRPARLSASLPSGNPMKPNTGIATAAQIIRARACQGGLAASAGRESAHSHAMPARLSNKAADGDQARGLYRRSCLFQVQQVTVVFRPVIGEWPLQ